MILSNHDLQTDVLTMKQAVEIQNDLNNFTLPNWNVRLSEDHFAVQILQELAELLDTPIPYKWWKKQETGSIFNAKMEAIDILHFALSIEYLQKCTKRWLWRGFRTLDYNTGYIDEKWWESDIYSKDSYIEEPIRIIDENLKLDHQGYMDVISHFISAYNTENLMINLFRSLNMNKHEVSAYYIAKNVLNEVRQKLSYKEGGYQKVKNGIEDNEILEGVINSYLSIPDGNLRDLSLMIDKEIYEWQGS